METDKKQESKKKVTFWVNIYDSESMLPFACRSKAEADSWATSKRIGVAKVEGYIEDEENGT